MDNNAEQKILDKIKNSNVGLEHVEKNSTSETEKKILRVIELVDIFRIRGSYRFNECVTIFEKISIIKNKQNEKDIQDAVNYLTNSIKIACERGKIGFEECYSIKNEIFYWLVDYDWTPGNCRNYGRLWI